MLGCDMRFRWQWHQRTHVGCKEEGAEVFSRGMRDALRPSVNLRRQEHLQVTGALQIEFPAITCSIEAVLERQSYRWLVVHLENC